MIGEADGDMHWRWEIFRRSCDPLDVKGHGYALNLARRK
jgi:hypothetical protein